MIESLFGTILIAIAIQTVAMVVISTNHISASLAERQIARMGARRMLDEVRTAQFDGIASTYHGQTFPIDLDVDSKSDLKPVPGSSEVGHVSVHPVPGGALNGEALRVVVEVEWLSSDGGDRTYSIMTTVARN